MNNTGIATLVVAAAGLVVVIARRIASAPPGRRPPCGNYGDVDGDGWVTDTDVQMVADYLSGIITLTDEQRMRADVQYGQGLVDHWSLMVIQSYVAGTVDTFPVCGV